MLIRDATKSDAAAISEIYNHYITNTIITFEEQPVSVAEIRNRIVTITKQLPWLVWEEEKAILGYAFAGPWKERSAYRYTVEGSVYLNHSAIGKGIGTQLFQALIDRLRELSVHSIIGGAALPNPASVALQEKMGFEKVAHFKEVGWKLGRWVDVGYWELILNPQEPNPEQQ